MSEYNSILTVINKLPGNIENLGEAYGLFWEKNVHLNADEKKKLIEKLSVYNDSSKLAKAWNIFSYCSSAIFTADFIKAIELGNEALDQFTQLDEKGGIMSASLMICLGYRSIGRLDKALDSGNVAITIARKLENGTPYDYYKFVAYYQLSEIQILLKKFDLAIDYLNEALKLDGGNPEIRGRIYTGLGNAYMNTPQWESAMEYFQDALKNIYGIKNFLLESKLYSDIGNYYFKKGDLKKALENQEKSLGIRLKNNLLNAAISNYIQLSELYDLAGETEKAITFGNLAIDGAEKINVIIKLHEAHLKLSKIYERCGQTEKAYEHFKKYHHYREKIFDQEIVTKIEQANTQHKIELMSQEKEIFRLRNVELKQALDEITESFKYAKRIQKAILPSDLLVEQYFSESFILYKPKDIVAGDFYWIDLLEDIPYFATCDCTGHGVPGAMVSVVCHNALNRATREFDIKEPNEVLNKTRSLVIEQFEKSDEDVKDGMDCVFFKIDTEKMLLTYSAANNGFYIVRAGTLIEYKGDKMPVGKFVDSTKSFTQHTIALNKGDMVYTFTDGYADQFGGPKGKKFGYKQFENLLLLIAHKTPSEQKNVLENTIETWKANEEQVDDILVVGLKIK